MIKYEFTFYGLFCLFSNFLGSIKNLKNNNKLIGKVAIKQSLRCYAWKATKQIKSPCRLLVYIVVCGTCNQEALCKF